MKVLLDTHVFLWWVIDDPQLPLAVRSIIADGNNELYLSAASCWEMAIKAQLGRLQLPEKADAFVAAQMSLNSIQGLPVMASHALHLCNLPLLHRDPFDRMLIAQSLMEGLPLVTSDRLLADYGIEIIWE